MYKRQQQTYGDTSKLPSPAFFYGLTFNEEIQVSISKGKTILIQYLNTNAPRKSGNRMVFFRINGTVRSVLIKDQSLNSTVVKNLKATTPEHIGSPLQGSLSKIIVKEGQEVKKDTPLFIIEAMKMESTITAPMDGVIKKIYLKEKTMVEQDDLVIEMG